MSNNNNVTLEVDSKDVIKLMLQFLKENNLSDSARILQEESGVSLNTVTSIESFLLDIHNGKWDSVLSQLNSIQLPKEKLIIIYEQIFLELLELGEKELAKELLKGNILYSLSLSSAYSTPRGENFGSSLFEYRPCFLSDTSIDKKLFTSSFLNEENIYINPTAERYEYYKPYDVILSLDMGGTG